MPDSSDRLRPQEASQAWAAKGQLPDGMASAILESIADGFYVLDQDWRFTHFNVQCERYFGRTRDEVLGRTLQEVLPNSQGSPIEATLAAAYRTHSPQSIETVSTVTGVPILLRAFPCVDGLTVVFTDVTERYRGLEALRESEERLRAALVAGKMAYWTWDPDTDELVASETMADLFGLLPGEVWTSSRWDLVHPEDRERHRALTENRNGWHAEFRIIRPRDGKIAWLEERSHATPDPVTGRLRLSGVVADVTDRKVVESALRESEAQVRRALSIQTVGVLFFNLDGSIVDANGAFERMSGWRLEDLRSHPHWDELTPADFHDATVQKAQELAEQGYTAPYEKQLLRPDGSRWWGLFAPTRLSGTGRDSRCVEFVIDITKRKQAEEELRRSQNRHAFLLALGDRIRPLTAPVSVMAAASEAIGRHLNVSRVGYGEIDSEEKSVTVERDWTNGLVSSLAGETRPLDVFGPTIIALLRSGRTLRLDDIAADPDAAPYAEGYASIGTRSLLIVPLIKEGRFTAFLYFHEPEPRRWTDEDVTLAEEVAERTWSAVEAARAKAALEASEEKLRALNAELEARVEERTRELQEAVRESEGFNYAIAHDLRAPLRAIVSTSSILVEEAGPELSEDHRSLLVRQAVNATRLGTLIDELLRLSRLARAKVRCLPLDMTAKAQSVAEVEASEWMGAVEVQEGMTAEGDPDLVRILLHNLIGNACKFSSNGGTVRVGQRGGAFYVSDEGVGFDMRYAERIFQPFERLVPESEFPGTGIGLASVERIVRRHGGRVWAEAELGKGATFFFTLGPDNVASGASQGASGDI